MKRSWLVGSLAALVAVLFLIPNLWAISAPKGEILIAPPAGLKLKKGPAKFSHEDHKDIDCKVCHHTWDGKSKIKKCSDAGCHDNKKSFFKAFHDRKSKRSCVGCHKADKKAGKKTGPTSCNKCHSKKK
ncbi:MAG: cytochrome c3 family protein [Desulfonauticus sp.]|nr:cytochrome c3 family protein [Desulfonauticus sp.]